MLFSGYLTSRCFPRVGFRQVLGLQPSCMRCPAAPSAPMAGGPRLPPPWSLVSLLHKPQREQRKKKSFLGKRKARERNPQQLAVNPRASSVCASALAALETPATSTAWTKPLGCYPGSWAAVTGRRRLPPRLFRDSQQRSDIFPRVPWGFAGRGGWGSLWAGQRARTARLSWPDTRQGGTTPSAPAAAAAWHRRDGRRGVFAGSRGAGAQGRGAAGERLRAVRGSGRQVAAQRGLAARPPHWPRGPEPAAGPAWGAMLRRPVGCRWPRARLRSAPFGAARRGCPSSFWGCLVRWKQK